MLDNKRQYISDENEMADPDEMMHAQPLITKKMERNPSYNVSVHDVRYRNFDENEEATKMLRIICLKFSYLKAFIVVPLISICTAFFFLLFLHWFPKLRKAFFYSESTLSQATHLFIMGTCK